MTLPDWSPGHIVAGKYTVQRLLDKSDNSRTYAAITETNLEILLRVFPHQPALERSLSALKKSIEELEPYALRIIEVKHDVPGNVLLVVVERSRHPPLATLVELCPLTLQEGLKFAANLGKAVDAAHKKGLQHLAMAPTNVFVGPAPECATSLADFGLPPPVPPKIEEALWRAPEQLDLKGESAATDVFSAALIIFFALTGKSYWRAEDEKALREEQAKPRVPASLRATEIGVTLPHAVDATFERALSSNPGKRFDSVGHLAEALTEVCKKDVSIAPPPLAPASEPKDLPKVIVERPLPPKVINDEPTVHTVRAAPKPEPPPPEPPPASEAVVRRGESTVLLARKSRLPMILIGLAGLLGVGALAGIAVYVIKSHKPTTTTLSTTIASAPIASETASAPPVPPPPASSDSSAPIDAGRPPMAADEGEIAVTCDPEPCDLVMVDAKKWDDYPVPYRVKEGKHGVGISKAKYWGDWKLVTVKAGERTDVVFKLTPRPPGWTAPGTTTTRPRRPPR